MKVVITSPGGLAQTLASARLPCPGDAAAVSVSLRLLQVLHYLAMQKPADLARHLLPCVIHAAVLKVKEEGKCRRN